ncbi:Oidioi.mRNA.OKI2018_I69.PAR.g10508.t1.cds [Oikopleura dioica]|uniref:Oidioi.mRNA.OKI2018_I69.PAR.g10508.t1.cds n=1 Tax=Oikopleura dioica TaxID=34765 RepID=A0ABN7RU31_OIKDI|nr:Oidioi.mRNA.OKI2018_I69.PAR.g10508.t1.cds [Oikopleura dioica]
MSDRVNRDWDIKDSTKYQLHEIEHLRITESGKTVRDIRIENEQLRNKLLEAYEDSIKQKDETIKHVQEKSQMQAKLLQVYETQFATRYQMKDEQQKNSGMTFNCNGENGKQTVTLPQSPTKLTEDQQPSMESTRRSTEDGTFESSFSGMSFN